MDDPPTVTILLLGDSECGKSTFISKLSRGHDSLRQQTSNLPLLRDADQPFVYDVRMYNRPYRFEFYDTAYAENIALLQPSFVILCYDINDRNSLQSLQRYWWRNMMTWYMQDRDEIPVMLLGLKRDLRVEAEGTIYPQEGHRVAAELRCDQYAECSAITGELMNEVFEDIARRAAKTTTEAGGKSQMSCNIM